MPRSIAKTLMLVAAVLALAAAPAHAGAGDVIRDCSEDGTLNKHYSQKELTGALDNLPSDLDEYTDCRTVIRQAQLAGAKGKGGKRQGILGLVDTRTPPSPDEQQKVNKAAGSAGPVEIGGKTIKPGATGAAFKAAGLGTHLPAYVLAALIGLAASMLGGAALAFRRRWPAAWDAAVATVAAPVGRIGAGVKRGIARFRRK